MSDEEYCNHCGKLTYSFSRKYAESTGELLCIACAEHTDQKYMAEHMCSICTRVMGNEAKFVLPSKAFGNEGGMPLYERLICTECYKREFTRSSHANMVKKKVDLFHSSARRSLLKGFLQRRRPIVAADKA